MVEFESGHSPLTRCLLPLFDGLRSACPLFPRLVERGFLSWAQLRYRALLGSLPCLEQLD